MNDIEFLSNIQTIQKAVQYWKSCVAQLDAQNARATAANIVGLMGNDHFDEWYEGLDDADFVEVFELATALELPDSMGFPKEERSVAWEELRRRLKILEQRYLTEKA